MMLAHCMLPAQRLGFGIALGRDGGGFRVFRARSAKAMSRLFEDLRGSRSSSIELAKTFRVALILFLTANGLLPS